MNLNKNYKDSGFVGTLFGVDIHYPIVRKEVRELVKVERELAWKTSEEQNISIYQVNNDFQDIQNQFLSNLEDDDKINFLNMKVEELNAHTNALNDETLQKEIEAANEGALIGYAIGAAVLILIFYVIFAH